MMQNKMVALEVSLERSSIVAPSYRPSGYALAVAVSNIVEKINQPQTKDKIKSLVKKKVELTYIVLEGSSLPLTASEQLWEALSTLEVAEDDNLSSYDLELCDDEGGALFRIEGIFKDRSNLLEGVSNFKSVSSRLTKQVSDWVSEGFSKEQAQFVDTTLSNIRTLEELQAEITKSNTNETLDRISEEMEELLATRKDDSQFRQAWEELRGQLAEQNSQDLIGSVPPHLRVEVTSPFDVYSDVEGVSEEDGKNILEAQLQSYLPHQYKSDGSMVLNLQGAVLRLPVLKKFKLLDELDEDYLGDSSTNLTYGEALFLYLSKLEGSLEVPKGRVDTVFASVLSVGLRSQTDFLAKWFEGVSSVAEAYKNSGLISTERYRTYLKEKLPFENYLGLLYVMYKENLFECIDKGLPDLMGDISRKEFAQLMN